MMDSNFRVEINSLSRILVDRGMEAGGRVQEYIDNEVLRLSVQYLPFENGELGRSGVNGTVPGSGEVQYKSPKARYLYYGKVMVGRAPKRLTSKNLAYHGAPQRGAKWFERMKIGHTDEILRGAGRIVGGR